MPPKPWDVESGNRIPAFGVRRYELSWTLMGG